MKKIERFIVAIILAGMLYIGITQDIPQAVAADKAYWSEFRSHSTVWASWEHFWFSVFGYRNASVQDVDKSKAQGWWGDTIYIDKGKK